VLIDADGAGHPEATSAAISGVGGECGVVFAIGHVVVFNRRREVPRKAVLDAAAQRPACASFASLLSDGSDRQACACCCHSIASSGVILTYPSGAALRIKQGSVPGHASA